MNKILMFIVGFAILILTFAFDNPVYFVRATNGTATNINNVTLESYPSPSPKPSPSTAIMNLDIMKKGFPKFFWFRTSEATFLRDNIQGLRYNESAWMNYFGQFDGVEGKLMDEEISCKALLPVFQQYKQNFPTKLALLHFNGVGRMNTNARDIGLYFPGHWLYRQGCLGLDNLNISTTTFKVENASLIDDKNLVNDHVLLVAKNAQGKPDWNNSEEVYVTGSDLKNNTITVVRGILSQIPRSFTANNYFVLPYGSGGEDVPEKAFWRYNFSVDCPRDNNNKRALDILVDELTSHFNGTGDMSSLDGIEFDVLAGSIQQNSIQVDTNGDTIPDNGIINGVDRFRQGAIEFASTLRTRIGNDKLLLGDGMYFEGVQRNFNYFNGIESEGWPIMKDLAMNDWSDGLNRMLFWNKNNSYLPNFNYMVTKARVGGVDQEMPASYWRLFQAVAVATDSIVSGTPWNNADTSIKPTYKLFDELVKGSANDRSGWLGMPLAPTIRLAKSAPDILNNTGVIINTNFVSKFTGTGLTFSRDGTRMKVHSTGGKMKFKMNKISTLGLGDLTIFCKLKANPVINQDANMAKIITMRAYDSSNDLIKEFASFANGSDFEASLYLKNLNSSTVFIEFEAEDNEDLWLSSMTVHGAPDAFYREFDNGVVIANPADHEYTFDIPNLPGIIPGVIYKRIQGTQYIAMGTVQNDSVTANNGQLVSGPISLTKDALFLEKIMPIRASDFTITTNYSIGNVENAQSLEADKIIVVNATVQNNYKLDQRIMLISALYDADNTIIDINYCVKEIATEKADFLSTSITLPSKVSGLTVKYFLWDSGDRGSSESSKMIPLLKVVKIPNQ